MIAKNASFKQALIPFIGGRIEGKAIVDLFAGLGGASCGIEMATGRSPDIAVNHDAHAIRLHSRNHPYSKHFCESVFEVDPRAECGGIPVGLLWLSPDCRHFSRAKGSAPVSASVRSLAWAAIRWATEVAPDIIVLENVPEFLTWGPLMSTVRRGKRIQIPDPRRLGETFQAFMAALTTGLERTHPAFAEIKRVLGPSFAVERLVTGLGYAIDWKELCAADYGVPTTRERLFVVARRDEHQMAWPEPTHGPGRAKPYRVSGSIIDWSIECPSIFLTRTEAKREAKRLRVSAIRRPLKKATLHRLAAGVVKYVVEAKRPFIAPVTPSPASNHLAAMAFMTKYYSGVVGSSLHSPLGTVTTVDHHGLCVVKLGRPQPEDPGQRRVAAFLMKYYGSGGQWQGLDEPCHTIVTRARFSLVLVTINGEDFAIEDIGMRMLEPRELAAAQGFPATYILEGSKRDQIARIGNAVCPPVAEQLVRALLDARPLKVAV